MLPSQFYADFGPPDTDKSGMFRAYELSTPNVVHTDLYSRLVPLSPVLRGLWWARAKKGATSARKARLTLFVIFLLFFFYVVQTNTFFLIATLLFYS